MTGKVAFVTGAGRGVGRGIALEFAKAGAAVVVNDLGVSLSGTEAGSVSLAQEVVNDHAGKSQLEPLPISGQEFTIRNWRIPSLTKNEVG